MQEIKAFFEKIEKSKVSSSCFEKQNQFFQELVTIISRKNLKEEEEALIYTNMPIFFNEVEDSYKYLEKAATLNSPYAETYNELAYHHRFLSMKHSANNRAEAEFELENACFYQKKALSLRDDFANRFSYASLMYEKGEYKQAKDEFLRLLASNEARNRLLLSIAYCCIKIGEVEEAIFYLKQVERGEDLGYFTKIDYIAAYELANAYYNLAKYPEFIELYDFTPEYLDFLLDEDLHYFYILYQSDSQKFIETVKSTEGHIKKEFSRLKKSILQETTFLKQKYQQELVKMEENLKKMILSLPTLDKKPEVKLIIPFLEQINLIKIW